MKLYLIRLARRIRDLVLGNHDAFAVSLVVLALSLVSCRGTATRFCAHKTALDARLDQWVTEVKMLGGPVIGTTAGAALDLGNLTVKFAGDIACLLVDTGAGAVTTPLEGLGVISAAPGAAPVHP